MLEAYVVGHSVTSSLMKIDFIYLLTRKNNYCYINKLFNMTFSHIG